MQLVKVSCTYASEERDKNECYESLMVIKSRTKLREGMGVVELTVPTKHSFMECSEKKKDEILHNTDKP